MPLRRYIFNTLTVVSLLLLLATVGLWVYGQIERDFNPLNVFQWDQRGRSIDSYIWVSPHLAEGGGRSHKEQFIQRHTGSTHLISSIWMNWRAGV